MKLDEQRNRNDMMKKKLVNEKKRIDKKKNRKRSKKKKVSLFLKSKQQQSDRLLKVRMVKCTLQKKCLMDLFVHPVGLNWKLKESFQTKDLIIQQLCMMERCLSTEERTSRKENTAISSCWILITSSNMRVRILKTMKSMKLRKINDFAGRKLIKKEKAQDLYLITKLAFTHSVCMCLEESTIREKTITICIS